jgi:hypothetical protein
LSEFGDTACRQDGQLVLAVVTVQPVGGDADGGLPSGSVGAGISWFGGHATGGAEPLGSDLVEPLREGGRMLSTLVVSAAVAVSSRGLWVVGLWLRLRAQVRRDEARLRYLAAALALPPDRHLAEVRPDGTILLITHVSAITGGDGRG